MNPVGPARSMDERHVKKMKEKYADMYLTMISLLTEEEISAGLPYAPAPLKSPAGAELDYSI